MNTQNTAYMKGAIEEVQRVAALFSGVFTQRQYLKEAKEPYGLETIRWRLKITLNEVKRQAGLSVNRNNRWGSPKRHTKGVKGKNTIERRCNMSECNKLFYAADHMRSCPACTKLKSGGGGDY